MQTFLNISYGSNLHPVRLRRRCPSARLVGTARLGGWRPAFHKRGKDGSAKCDAVRTGRTGDHLWVAMFEIERGEKDLLDAAEGLGHGYDEVEVLVTVSREQLTGTMYVARAAAINPTLLPYDWYHAMVLLGARFHGFPGGYQERIGTVGSVPDPHPSRPATRWEIVREMKRANRPHPGTPPRLPL